MTNKVLLDELEYHSDGTYWYNGALFTGVGVDYHTDGFLWSVTPIQNGKAHGRAVEFRADGSEVSWDEYFNGELDGFRVSFNLDGTISSASLVRRGIAAYRWSAGDEDGLVCDYSTSKRPLERDLIANRTKLLYKEYLD